MSKKNTRLPQILAAAAILAAASSMPAFAASGWEKEDSQWVYLDRNGDKVTDSWKKSGSHWFYLDEDGYMATDRLIEDDDDYFYVNEAGAMVKNEWRNLEDDSEDEGYEDGTCWYYFGKNGQAAKNSSGKVKLTTINGKKYAFSDTGKMLHGWVSEDGTMITEEEGWADGMIYCGESGDGAVTLNQWLRLEVEDPEADDEADGSYWFYFDSKGKKYADTTKSINGKRYRFDERGVAQFKWYTGTSSNASASGAQYFNEPDQCWQADGWFYTVPTEEIDPEAYSDDQEYWFYADKKGNLAQSQIKTINHYKYGFNEKGEMLEGLYAITFDEDKKIDSYEKIESIEDMPGEDDERDLYYFGNTPKDGVMATKKNTKVELDGETYDFGFRSNGASIHGISDNAIYIKGQKQKADKEMKLQEITFEGESYLVNTSGTIQKKKNNVKDADETYYCTDEKGIVTYRGDEKRQ
ncbi:MAG: cell wall-binding protein [Lachnospiraceae bacterium]|nr:cell wall-binding protein [Lachnospiraceae bacterium]